MSRPLRVAIVVPGWRAADAPPALPALEDLVWSLAARPDLDLRIVTLRHPGDRCRYRDVAGVPVIALGGGTRAGVRGRTGLAFGALRALRRLHREWPVDLLHGFWVDEPGAIAAVAGRLSAVPVAISVMGGELVSLADMDYGAALGVGGRVATQVSGRGADLVTVGSRLLFRSAAAWMPELPLRLAPLGVDTERFRPAADAPDTAARVLAVGSLVPVKDPVLLLRAFARVRTPGAELMIAGVGPMRAGLERLAARLAVADRVRFLGAVARDELPDLYRSARALAVSSRHEAQCMVAVEAAACGLPWSGRLSGSCPSSRLREVGRWSRPAPRMPWPTRWTTCCRRPLRVACVKRPGPTPSPHGSSKMRGTASRMLGMGSPWDRGRDRSAVHLRGGAPAPLRCHRAKPTHPSGLDTSDQVTGIGGRTHRPARA